MSQCGVLAKYLLGGDVGGVRRHTWPSLCLWFGSKETEGGRMVKSSPPTDVVSEPVTFTPDPFTI